MNKQQYKQWSDSDYRVSFWFKLYNSRWFLCCNIPQKLVHYNLNVNYATNKQVSCKNRLNAQNMTASKIRMWGTKKVFGWEENIIQRKWLFMEKHFLLENSNKNEFSFNFERKIQSNEIYFSFQRKIEKTVVFQENNFHPTKQPPRISPMLGKFNSSIQYSLICTLTGFQFLF